jgi:hypothetical protein
MSNTQNAGQRPKLARDKTFDLDALEKEGKAPKPLPVRLGGEEFVFGDLDEGDYWSELAPLALSERQSGEDLEGQFRIMLGDEQFERFRKHRLPGWKVKALYEHLDSHFGFSSRLGDPGEDDASSGS